MTDKHDPFEYDVAVSFASADSAAADELIRLLAERGIQVFRDEYDAANAQGWGKDMLDHLVNLYARKSRYCVLLVSAHYPLKTWTHAERTSVRERALRDAEQYILPVQLDDRQVPGMAQAASYMDLREHTVEELAKVLGEKLRKNEARSGPPPQSHDLRSGNIPTQINTSGEDKRPLKRPE
jgi:hypothetical protein